MSLKRVLLIEDSVFFRSALRAVLEQAGFHVIACDSQTFAGNTPRETAVVILDVVTLQHKKNELPGLVRECAAHAPVLLLGREDRVESLVKGLKAGAVGLVNQTVSAKQLRQAIAAVTSGGAWCETALFRSIVQYLPAVGSGGQPRLTKREAQVLKYLLRGRTNRQIARRLSLSEQCIKFHVSNLLRKTRTSTRTSLSLYAVRRGLAPAEGT